MQSRRTCVNILGTSGISVWQRFACKPTLALQSPPHGLCLVVWGFIEEVVPFCAYGT